MLLRRLRTPACAYGPAARAHRLTTRITAAAADIARMDRPAAGEYHDSDFKWEDIAEAAQQALAKQV